MNKKIPHLLFFIAVFAGIGFCREFFFVNLNVILHEKYYHSTHYVPEIMTGFRRFSYETLYYSKYVFTVLWVSVFFLVNFFALKKLSSSPRLTHFLIYAYIVMFALAALSFVYGYFFNNGVIDDEYTLSRWLMGMAQSPVICLLLLASEKLYNKSFQS